MLHLACVQILSTLNVITGSMLQHLHRIGYQMKAEGYINGIAFLLLYYYYVYIRECLILYVGLQHAISPIKTKCKA